MMQRQRRKLDRGRRQPSIYSRTEQQERPKINWGKPFLAAVLLLALTYLLFLSPVLKIKTISTNSLSFVDQGRITDEINKARNILPFGLSNNILLFSASSLNQKIGEIDGVNSVKVIKNYPSTIRIETIEKKPGFVWQTGDKKYIIDDRGYAIDTFSDRYQKLPTVVDTKNVPTNVGSQIVSPEFPTFISDLTKDFNTYAQTAVLKIEVPEITTEVKVTTVKGWYVLFDTTNTAKSQLVNVARVIQAAKTEKKNLEYIDLRIDNRIFYK